MLHYSRFNYVSILHKITTYIKMTSNETINAPKRQTK
jgi:hypothetical protein